MARSPFNGCIASVMVESGDVDLRARGLDPQGLGIFTNVAPLNG